LNIIFCLTTDKNSKKTPIPKYPSENFYVIVFQVYTLINMTMTLCQNVAGI